MNQIELIATSAFGLESIVARELKALGYDELRIENGRVLFSADYMAIPRCNLWLRSADRLLVKIGEFKALRFDELFEQTRALPWDSWLSKDANFPVEGKSIKSKLFSVSDCQAIVKKAVVEKMRENISCQWFPETGPRYRIEVSLLADMATLTIDTSGVGLHKRGYRRLAHQAPLKETLAAALIHLSRWKADRTLIDPFCGSGTIPIEAALIGLNIAPGLRRKFAAEAWPQISPHLWQKSRQEAQDLINKDQALGIMGFDIDKSAIDLARHHAREAGLSKYIAFQQQDITQLRSKYKYGYLIANPPYGERLQSLHAVEKLYRELGRSSSLLDTWSYYVLTPHPGFEKLFGHMADKKRKLYNGRIQCHYYQFYGPKPLNLQGPFSI